MKPDELNEWLAVNLFGYTLRERQEYEQDLKQWTKPHGKSWRFGLPNFVGTYDGMGAVIEKMRERGWAWQGNSTPGQHRFRFFREADVSGVTQFARDSVDGSLYQFASTIILAVALAAKAALEAK